MNSKLKHTFTSLILSSLTVGGLVSCDGADQSTPIQTTADVLNSTAPTEEEVLANDLIRYQTNDSSTPFLASLTFAGNRTVIGDSTYEYFKTGTALSELRVLFDAENALPIAFDNVVSGRLGAPLASRIRQLLIRPIDQNFSPGELQELVEILNAGGANLQVKPDNSGLRIPRNQTYSQLTTTTVRDRNQGSMGGSYVLASRVSDIIFTVGTATQTNQYRFFTNALIPSISSVIDEDPRDEVGTFSIEFINPPN